jgi:hypothetical protein
LTIFNGLKWFYCTVENLEESTSLGKASQSSCINKLISLGLIKQINKKLPTFASQKRFFHIVEDIDLLYTLLVEEEIEEEIDIKNDVSESVDMTGKENIQLFECTIFNSSNVKKSAGRELRINNKDLIKQQQQEVDNSKDDVVVESIRKKFFEKTKNNLNRNMIRSLLKIKTADDMIGLINKFHLFGKIENPPAFFVDAVRNNYAPPVSMVKQEEYKGFDQRKYDDEYFNSLYKEL